MEKQTKRIRGRRGVVGGGGVRKRKRKRKGNEEKEKGKEGGENKMGDFPGIPTVEARRFEY